jgi:type I restriction enzyme S subunit
MKSNYKPIGDYIQPVDERNTDLQDLPLMGLSISKQFIPSIANTVGTDMKMYKIVSKNQFTYIADTSRRGDKIAIALSDEHDQILVSQAYTTFAIIDTEKLLPEYLMMWFRRSEFDRYARFHSHGSVREIFDWQELCETPIPVPSITTQRQTVAEYNAVQNCINQNKALIEKLEQTAQAIYKEWFVDKVDRKNLPCGWKMTTVNFFCIDMKSGGTPSRTKNEYWNSHDVPWIKTSEIKNNIVIQSEEFISNEGFKNSTAKSLPKDTVLMSMYGVNAGEIGILKFEATTNQACCGMICENPQQSAYLYYHLLHKQEFIASQAIGGAQENLSKDFIAKIEIIKPTDEVLNQSVFKVIVDNKEILTRESQKLEQLKTILLSRLTTDN